VNIPLPHLALSFGDFALLAILLAMMYALTALEVWLTPAGRNAAGVPLVQRKRAAAYAFFGIFLTLVAGAISDARHTETLFLVPFGCIAYWGYFHWKTTSQLIDVQVIVDQFNEAYKNAVLAVVNEAPTEGLTVQRIHELTLDREPYTKLLTVGSPILKQVLPLAIGDVAARLLPTTKRTEEVLRDLEKEGIIRRTAEGGFSGKLALDTH
jgi:hypothetical protein